LAVDRYLRYDPLQLDVSSLYRFENPDPLNPKAAAASLRLDGLEAEDIKVILDDKELTAPVQSFNLTISPSSKEDVSLKGTFVLEDYPLVEIRYPLTHTVPWAGRVSSIRVTVHFPELSYPEQWAEAYPTPDYFDGFSLTWHRVDVEPSEELKLTLIHPSVWKQLTQLEDAVRKGDASTDKYYQLGALYRTLALASPTDSPGFERFYRQAVAYLEEARRVDPALYQASLDLAALYRQKAFLPDGEVNAPYLALCIGELEKALEAGAPKSSFAWSLQELYIALGQELRENGQFESALDYFDKALAMTREGFAGPESEGELEATIMDTYALWAQELLVEGKYREALALIYKGLGSGFLKLLGIRLPLCESARAVVVMKPGKREVICSCTPGPLFNAFDEDLTAFKSSLPSQAKLGELQGKLVLNIEVPFSNTDELREGLKELSESIPVRGEFGACLAGLTGTQIQWDWQPEFMGRRLTFKERVDMSQAEALLELEKSTAKRREAEIRKGGVFKSEALEKLALSLCRAAREGWGRLRDNTTLEYELVLDSGVRQNWFLKPGDVISLERELWEPYPWVKPAFGLALSTLGVLLVILILKASLKAKAPE